MLYRIEIAPKARRDLDRLPASVLERVRECIDALATDPRPRGVEKLAGRPSRYRVRSGSYRIVYRIEDGVLRVLVLTVDHRRRVYKDG